MKAISGEEVVQSINRMLKSGELVNRLGNVRPN
jgi:hypothetical protein